MSPSVLDSATVAYSKGAYLQAAGHLGRLPGLLGVAPVLDRPDASTRARVFFDLGRSYLAAGDTAMARVILNYVSALDAEVEGGAVVPAFQEVPAGGPGAAGEDGGRGGVAMVRAGPGVRPVGRDGAVENGRALQPVAQAVQDAPGECFVHGYLHGALPSCALGANAAHLSAEGTSRAPKSPDYTAGGEKLKVWPRLHLRGRRPGHGLTGPQGVPRMTPAQRAGHPA